MKLIYRCQHTRMTYVTQVMESYKYKVMYKGEGAKAKLETTERNDAVCLGHEKKHKVKSYMEFPRHHPVRGDFPGGTLRDDWRPPGDSGARCVSLPYTLPTGASHSCDMAPDIVVLIWLSA